MTKGIVALAFALMALVAAADGETERMRTIYADRCRQADGARLMSRLNGLWRTEFGQTTPCQRRAAEKVVEYLRADGFSRIESIEQTIDGRAVSLDNRMPYAWDASVGRLTIVARGNYVSANTKYTGSDTEDVVADYARHPFHLVKGSTATPPGGIRARVLTEAQFLAGEDATGALVMLEPETWPRAGMLRPILDRGGLGFITDFLTGRFETPDSLQWVTACTETASWSVDGETRPFVGYSVTPRVGARLRTLAAMGGLEVLAESDGRRYESTLPFVTAVVPGRRTEEFWIFAHLYEPLASDDSCGVVAAIEIARQFLDKEPPEFTIRLLFGIEFYGYAAYLSRQECPLRNRVVGGLNVDSIPAQKGTFLNLELGGPSTPFYGNALVENLAHALEGQPGVGKIAVPRYGDYYDDIFMAEPSIGVPSIWCQQKFYGARLWHNSFQTPDNVDVGHYRRNVGFAAALTELVARPNAASIPAALDLAKRRIRRAADEAKSEEHFRHLAARERAQLADFARFAGTPALTGPLAELDAFVDATAASVAKGALADSPWRQAAARLVPSRKRTGFPYDLTRVPVDRRIALPDGSIYGAFGNVFANIDGRKDLARLIREAEYERGLTLDEDSVKDFVNAIAFLAEWDYIGLADAAPVGEAEIVRALAAAGVRSGDTLLVQSDLASLGRIEGGAETVLKALAKAVGDGGTVLLPAFTPSVRMCGAVNRSWDYRPYGSAVRIGMDGLTVAFLRKYPDAVRSAHYVRSWTGWGPAAADLLGAQRADAAPFGDDSPVVKACRRGAKTVLLGDLAPVRAEAMQADACRSGLGRLASAVVGVKAADGVLHDVIVPDFPQAPVETVTNLPVREVPLGPGFVRVVTAPKFSK